MAELERVVVVGGGVGGLTAALALRKAGIEVEVHEKYPELAGRATGFTLWSYAIKHLMDLGLDDPTQIGSPIEYTDIHNHHGDLIEQMPVGEVSKELGAPSCDVNRRDLQRVANEMLGDVVHMGSEVVDVEVGDDRATAILADGGRAEGDLVIGADGAHSITRDKVAKAPKLRYSGYAGWGGVLDGFSHELLEPRRHIEIWGGGSKAGVADVGNGHFRWYVTQKAPEGTAQKPVDKAEIQEHVKDWWELIRAAVDAAPVESIVRTEAYDMEPIETWFDRRLVLLGDSAHLTTPFASMGACMTIDDAVKLVEQLTSAPTVDEALKAYEAERKKRDEDIVRKSRRMGGLSQIDSPILSWLRDQAFEHMPEDKIRQVTAEMAKGE